MKIKCAFGLLLLGLVSCSSVGIKKHSSGRGIYQIDALIVEMKKEYLKNCYEVVAAKDAPETRCANNLFGVVTRRHGTNYTEEQLERVTDDVFFQNYISKRLNTLIKGNGRVRRQVKKKYSSRLDLVRYYSKIYSFID